MPSRATLIIPSTPLLHRQTGGEHDEVSDLISLLPQAGTSWVTAVWARIVSVEADVVGSPDSTPPRSSAAYKHSKVRPRNSRPSNACQDTQPIYQRIINCL